MLYLTPVLRNNRAARVHRRAPAPAFCQKICKLLFSLDTTLNVLLSLGIDEPQNTADSDNGGKQEALHAFARCLRFRARWERRLERTKCKVPHAALRLHPATIV